MLAAQYTDKNTLQIWSAEVTGRTRITVVNKVLAKKETCAWQNIYLITWAKLTHRYGCETHLITTGSDYMTDLQIKWCLSLVGTSWTRSNTQDSGADLGYFLNVVFKTVGHHGWPKKKTFCYMVSKSCLKQNFKGIKFHRIIQLSPGVFPSHKCFNE